LPFGQSHAVFRGYAAFQFSPARGIKIDVVAGPAGKWIDAARANADLIYSSSETMMTDFVDAMGAGIFRKRGCVVQ
jgi:accessory colonization factor AcfC